MGDIMYDCGVKCFLLTVLEGVVAGEEEVFCGGCACRVLEGVVEVMVVGVLLRGWDTGVE